eukprot:6393911-Amphidinium_carterae.1
MAAARWDVTRNKGQKIPRAAGGSVTVVNRASSVALVYASLKQLNSNSSFGPPRSLAWARSTGIQTRA